MVISKGLLEFVTTINAHEPNKVSISLILYIRLTTIASKNLRGSICVTITRLGYTSSHSSSVKFTTQMLIGSLPPSEE